MKGHDIFLESAALLNEASFFKLSTGRLADMVAAVEDLP